MIRKIVKFLIALLGIPLFVTILIMFVFIGWLLEEEDSPALWLYLIWKKWITFGMYGDME